MCQLVDIVDRFQLNHNGAWAKKGGQNRGLRLAHNVLITLVAETCGRCARASASMSGDPTSSYPHPPDHKHCLETTHQPTSTFKRFPSDSFTKICEFWLVSPVGPRACATYKNLPS
jgi:hypothetical protein